jgi:hypothetical protein
MLTSEIILAVEQRNRLDRLRARYDVECLRLAVWLESWLRVLLARRRRAESWVVFLTRFSKTVEWLDRWGLDRLLRDLGFEEPEKP